jgi:hypothetical protein
MNSDISPSPIPEQTNLPPSLTTEINPSQERKKEGFGIKIRQTLNAAGVRVQASRQRKISIPDLLNLTPQSQVRLKFSLEIPIFFFSSRNLFYVQLKRLEAKIVKIY